MTNKVSNTLALNNGKTSQPLKAGQPNTFKAKAGEHYRIVKKGKTGEEQLLDDVIAKKSGDDLVLNYADGTQVTLENYYAECNGAAACDITLPGQDAGSYKVGADSTAGAALGDGSTLAYAHGSRDALMGMAEGNAALNSALTGLQGAEISYVPAASFIDSIGTLGLWGIGGLALIGGGVGAALAAGGGGGATTDTTPTVGNTVTNSITGAVVAGPVVAGHGLRVNLYRADGTTLLGSGVLDSSGTFSIDVGGYTGVVIAKLVNTDANPDYRDEATGQLKDLNANLMAIGVASTGTVSLNINALTTIAATKAGAVFAGASAGAITADVVTQTNTAVASAFGLTDLTGTTIVTTVAVTGAANPNFTPDALTAGEKYGAVLAALSGADSVNNGNVQTTIDSLSAGLTITGNTGTLSTAALNTIIVGAHTAAATASGAGPTSLTAIVSDALMQANASNKAVVDAYSAILNGADGNAANNNATATAAQYGLIGVTGVAAASASLVNDVVDGKVAVDVDTVTEVQTLADAAAAVMTGATGNSAPTPAQLQALGITGVTADNLSAVLTAIAATADDGSGVDTVDKLQAVVSVVVNNEAPTAVALSASTVAENATGAIIGNLTVTDPDAGNTHTFAVDDARFEVVSGQLKLKAGSSLDFETAGTVNVTVTATDTGGLSKAQAFAITVTDVNEAPTAIALSASTVAENATGAIIGNLTVTDPDAGNTHTFAVDDARFEVVSGQLKLKAGSSLDFETASTVNVTVTATDAGGLSKAQAFAITVTDVAETTTLVGTADADTINFPTGLDDFIITGLAGNDTINTGVGNDIIRPGEGADAVNTGAGNDIVVVVGQTAASQYAQSDITNPGGSGIDLSRVITLADLNGRAISEVVSGESIDGGAGTNRLVIYGNVDLTGTTLTNITQFQVNSTVTISAQQLAALDLSVIFGDGESVLNITNSSADPVTLDLSGMSFTDFHTFNVGSGVTVVLDQADVDSLQYLSGEGTLKASTATGTLNLAGKYVTLDVQYNDGIADTTHGGGTYVAGKLLIGTESAETLTGGTFDDRIEGGAGNDVLVGSDGNDVLRGGAGVDSMDGGAGNDTFVIVGDISGGGKVDSAADTAALGFPLTNLNGQNLNEDEDGAAEIIIGGEGDDTLYVYGTADLTNYDITGIEHIEIRSDVTFTVLQLSSIQSLRGDGASIVRINTTSGSTTPEQLDLSSLSLSQIGHIAVGDNVTVQTPSVGALGGATLLSGNGSLMATSGTLDLTGVTQITTLNVRNADGTLPSGVTRADAVIVSTGNVTTKVGTNGDDIVFGTSNGEILVGGDGADRLIGAGGNDLLYGDSQSIGTFNISRDTPTVVGSNYLEQGLGGNAGFGEGVLVPNDDLSTGAIDITSVFGANGLNFFGRSFTSVYANNNGNITFAGAASQFTPDVINAGATNPIIAPFWGDVDTRGSAPNTPTPNGNSTGSNRVYYDLDSARGIFTVTWDDVGYYNYSTDKLNAFQLQLLDKGEGNFDIVYRYEDVNWTTGNASGGSGGLGGTVARAGYSSGTTEGYYELPQSGNQAQMLALDENGKYVFSVRNGLTHTSSNNDTLIGGAGNDILIGGDGEHDVAVFSGALNEYDIRPIGNTIEVADHTPLRNGKDMLFSDVEFMKFSDGEVGTASYFHTDISTIRSEEIFTNADRLSVTKTIADVNGSDARLDVEGSGGYYKLFFALSSAAYVHIPALQEFPGMLPPAVTPNQPAVSFDEKNLAYLIDAGLQPLNASDFSQYGFSQSSNVKFADGYFLSNVTEGLDRASVATVFRSSDALFLTFRGTNLYRDDDGIIHFGDVYDDAFDMQGHYDRYSSLFNAIDYYLADTPNGIDTVYVSGHSLGGQMAMMYMDNHQGNKFKAVTFEAANKLHEAGVSLVHSVEDQRFVNFEINGDVVPDLGLLTGENNISGNYGKTIHLDYESSPWIFSHTMSHIATQFDGIAEVLDGATIGMNERVYVDDDNTEGNASNGDGLIVAETESPFVPLSVAADLAQVYLPGTTAIVNGALYGVISNVTSDNATSLSDAITFVVREDNAEYQSTGYNLQTVWGHGENYDDGTLVIKPINAGQYNLPQSGVGALVVANNTFISENVDVNAAASDHGVIVIGNDGDNKLVGSAHNDVLIGGGDRLLGKGDLLIGGTGDDFLYGGNFSQQVKLDAPLSDYPLSSKGSAALSDYSAGDVVDDVSFLVGGYGKDSMYGSGDNDYFFIDVNLSGNNATNVDQIHDFYVAGDNLFADDWLVFSAQQLGLTTGYMKDTLGWDEISVDIFGHTDTAYNLDLDGGGVAGIATEYWIKVDGIQNYSAEFSSDLTPAFILDTSVGNLYYDVDGDRDVGDEVLVARIAASTASGADVLTDMHANQILVIPNFNLWA